MFKAPLSVKNCRVPTTRFVQTFFLCYSIKTTFYALGWSNRTESVRKVCDPKRDKKNVHLSELTYAKSAKS